MNRCLLVSGFHRSGTSMTMQALSKAGVQIGPDLIGPNSNNQDGHFEAATVVSLHDTALSRANGDWLSPSTDNDLHKHWSRAELNSIDRFVDSFKNDECWGFKDPRACLFLPFWKKVIPDLFVVFVFRHYLHCIQSLRNRAANSLATNPSTSTSNFLLWNEPDIALRSWISYNQKLIQHYEDNKSTCMVLSQQAIVNGYPLISALNKSAHLDLNYQLDTNICKDKTTDSLWLPYSMDGIDPALIDEADNVWERLKALDAGVLPTINNRTAHFVENTEDWKYSLKHTLKAIDFDFNRLQARPDKSNTPHGIPPLANFTSVEIQRYKKTVRVALRHKRDESINQLIQEYSNSKFESFFGELILAERSIIDKDYNSARKHLDNTKKFDESDSLVHYFNGILLERENKLFKAEISYSDALKEEPSNIYFCLAFINILTLQKKLHKALNASNHSRSIIKQNLQIELKRFHILLALGRVEEASFALQKANETWPNNPSLLQANYNFNSEYGNSDSALKLLNNLAIARIKRNPDYFNSLSTVISNIEDKKDRSILWTLLNQKLTTLKEHYLDDQQN